VPRAGVSGVVDVVAEAFDTTPIPVPASLGPKARVSAPSSVAPPPQRQGGASVGDRSGLPRPHPQRPVRHGLLRPRDDSRTTRTSRAGSATTSPAGGTRAGSPTGATGSRSRRRTRRETRAAPRSASSSQTSCEAPPSRRLTSSTTTPSASISTRSVGSSRTDSYWARGRPRPRSKARFAPLPASSGSTTPAGRQIGFARAVSDGVVTAYLADVYVLAEHRGARPRPRARPGAGGARLARGLRLAPPYRRRARPLRQARLREPSPRLMERGRRETSG
jgi:hypothetical protein